MKSSVIWLVAAALSCATTASAQKVSVDPNLPNYEPVNGISGSIKSVGSDTMNNMMALWGEGFKKYYPNVRIEIDGKGSSTAPVSLINGTANFGAMSRAMKLGEIDDFEKKFGYKPTQLKTAIDMLAVFVNKDNPIAKPGRGLTLPQVDAIFSQTRKLGYQRDVTRWGQVGSTGAFASKKISMFGRNSASGTNGYFKQVVLGGGDFKNSVKEQPGSSAVVRGVGTSKTAIGYCGIGYKAANVKAVALATQAGAPFIAAEPRNASTYPLSRFLYLYVNHKPGDKGIGPLYTEFVKYVYSQAGQEAVIKDGYLPVNAKQASQALRGIGIKPAVAPAP